MFQLIVVLYNDFLDVDDDIYDLSSDLAFVVFQPDFNQCLVKNTLLLYVISYWNVIRKTFAMYDVWLKSIK